VTYASGHSEAFGALSLAMTIWILMVLQVCFVATMPLISRTIEEEITSGAFTSAINKPYSYLLFHYSGFMGRALPTLCINLIIGSLAAFFLVGLPPIGVINIAAALVLLFLGFLLNFLISFSIGMLAFWIKETMPITWLYWKGETLFGGFFIPIALMPPVLQTVAEILPFSHVFYNAAFTLVNFNHLLFFKFFVIQCIWIICFLAIALHLLKKGTDRVLINGG
jgi:ABC-2 type transport system permease protein